MGPAIPRRLAWREIRAWAKAHRITPDEEDDLHHLLSEMEQEFAAIEAERRAAAK